MGATLRLTILGDFRLSLDDEPVTELNAPRRQELLVFLVLHRGTPQPRRRTAFLLWPDTTEPQALTNLRRELHHLRRDLPDADRCLRIDARTLEWRDDAPCRVDVVEFEAAIATADAAREAGQLASEREQLERAAGAYHGDLLPGCYAEWIEPERERLRRSFVRGLEALVAAHGREGDIRAAIRAAERLVSHDPLREANHARLLELHAAIGDRAAALEAYDHGEAILKRELGVEPGPALRQARAAAMAATGIPATDASPPDRLDPVADTLATPVTGGRTAPEPGPLVGREDEVSALRDWLALGDRREEGGPPQLLLLTGEPGIGKTRLLDELATRIRDSGGRVVRGRGFEAEMVRPYGAWIDALRSLPPEWTTRAPELGFLLPEIRGSESAPSDRSRLFDVVARWLRRLRAEGEPVAVLMDDIQWLDEASAALLHYIARLSGDSPILMACAARPAELDRNAPVAGLLRGLERARRIRALQLGPMDREQTAALARSIHADVDTERVFADSGGNPLFAQEVAHALATRTEGDQPAPLDDLVRDRLARLDPDARELLSWAAALGRGFDPSTAALVAGRPLPELLPALERLEQYGVLRPAAMAGSTSYDFAHDIVRRAAYASLSEPRRRLVHLRIAEALNELDDSDGALAGDIAHHASLGGNPALAASAATTAGVRCLRIFAYAEATELARRGIEHTRSLEGPERLRLHLALLRVQIAAGARRPGGAAELDLELRDLVADAQAMGSLHEEAVAHSLLSVLNYDRENFARVHQSSLDAVDALRALDGHASGDPGTTARTLAQTGACLASIEREMRRAESLLLEAQSLAKRTGIELTDISMGLGMVRHFRGRSDEAVRLLEQALRLGRAQRNHFCACECLAALVGIALDNDWPDRAHAWCRELLPVAAKLKEGSEEPFSRALHALTRYALAADDADTDLAASLETLRRMDTSRKLARVQVHAAEIDLAAGRAELALERAEEALGAARVIGHRSSVVRAHALLVSSARQQGHARRARSELRRLREELEDEPDVSARARAAVAALEEEEWETVASRPSD